MYSATQSVASGAKLDLSETVRMIVVDEKSQEGTLVIKINVCNVFAVGN